jgi:hypothetical protein
MEPAPSRIAARNIIVAHERNANHARQTVAARPYKYGEKTAEILVVPATYSRQAQEYQRPIIYVM